MDRLIYTAMTGAKQTMARQDTMAQNLANANTAGYRADTTAFRSAPIRGVGEGTRVFSVETTPGTDFTPGPIQRTDRELDVAMGGNAYLAVQSLDGSEAYTRAGSLQIDAQGTLTTRSGLLVMGDGGPISIPPDSRISIANDGTISVTAEPGSGALSNVTVVGRLKMVTPPNENDLVKGGDGLFRMRSGDQLPLDDTAQLSSGSIEGSNVNVVEAMVGIIAAARQFEMHMKLLTTADADSRAASQLLSVNG